MRAAYDEAALDAPQVSSLDGRKWARISRCGLYRYTLGRGWDGSRPTMVVIGINPSTADHETGDPTVTRCMDFAADSGHGAVVIVNLFGWRDKDVRVLATVENPVGPFGDFWLSDATAAGGTVVWGSGPPSKVPARLRSRFATVERRLRDGGRVLHALDFTKDGYPAHPLMLKKTCRPVVWR